MSSIIPKIGIIILSQSSFFSLYKIYPARAPAMNSTAYQELIQHSPDISAGQGRSANIQCGIQVAALVITLAISIAGGLFTGSY
jgi:hypothetical protein